MYYRVTVAFTALISRTHVIHKTGGAVLDIMKTFHKVFLGYQYLLEFKLPEKAKNISAAIAINVPRKQRKNC